jgi:hypothetical protein
MRRLSGIDSEDVYPLDNRIRYVAVQQLQRADAHHQQNPFDEFKESDQKQGFAALAGTARLWCSPCGSHRLRLDYGYLRCIINTQTCRHDMVVIALV